MPQYASFAERLIQAQSARRASAAAHKELMMRLGLPLIMEREEKAKDRAHALLLEDKRTAREMKQIELNNQVKLDIAKEVADVKLTLGELTAKAKQAAERESKPADFTLQSPSGDKHYTHIWNPLTNTWDRKLVATGEPDRPQKPDYKWAKNPVDGKVMLATPEEIRSQGLEPVKIGAEYEPLWPEETAPADTTGRPPITSFGQ